ncbi:MAG: hypothetical protein E7L01_07375 [Paenibacillus macerans]|uniref:Thioredoxin domain-containing protein n=1 Tax=Paenibacillus macerans TaxID=44252 RepID=A0A090Y7H8_PAEMA|nr:hypothetical protein [Paenibacillus macerans]KFM94718.1 hypothetical protein DJ90_5931 [Paenibacillus macerans]MBS5910987.1 hypothetical protein [Paenibacillus macerans]MCY7558612.1 hypothetical protein [Paenibacillus macerans]MDU7473163.1 hypothetical protein [Paenibacillus macerans]MEC0139811.1 hypothetical protein [Paenibacillus macerans]
MSFLQLFEVAQWFIIIIMLFFMTYIFNKSYEAASVNYSMTESNSNKHLEIGSFFPSLSLLTITNEVIELNNSNHLGSIVLFSVHGCNACERLYPQMDSIADNLPNYQVISIMIAPLNSVIYNKSKYKLKLPIHHVELDEMYKYGTSTFPFCYVVSNTGEIINKGIIQNRDDIGVLLQNNISTVNMDEVS